MGCPSASISPVGDVHVSETHAYDHGASLLVSDERVSESRERDHGERNLTAVMDVEDLWLPNQQIKADAVFDGDGEHPAIDYMKGTAKHRNTGERLHGFEVPPQHDYRQLYKMLQPMRDMIEGGRLARDRGVTRRETRHNASTAS